ncbi:hypothetical protein [Klebsiella pasteurii]|uniref:hypothetical protein n=1 Tax=Klebsiella pasteurii TaxID=2587529 RepID=UPI0035CF1D97
MTKAKFNNGKKGSFLNALPVISLDSGDIATKSKFNFCYFDGTQAVGQDFCDWSHEELIKLLGKMKHYSASPLEYWRHERTGGGGLKIFEIYGAFPKQSGFTHPKHVPHDVSWARFRMENLVRLIGFVVPRGFKSRDDVVLKEPFDANTFYVVFLDRNHQFYLTESP